MSKTRSLDRLDMAARCVRVSLRPRYERLAEVAVDLHLLANDGSGERYHDGRDDARRAEQGYRAELAVAQHYDLRPEVDYRPPGVGDPGRDFWADYLGDTVTIDVKATSTDPPQLYLTKKRAWSDRYTLPDWYLLTSTALTDDDAVHLVGWVDCETVRELGEETEVYDNPVWRLDAGQLQVPPAPSELEPLDRPVELRADADRLEDSS